MWRSCLRKLRWNDSITYLRRFWAKRTFDKVAKGILNTAPLDVQGLSPLFLSMVCHRDVTAYLLAIKSLYFRFKQGRVVIINDGSLSAEDLETLRLHIPGLEVVDIAAIDTGPCPRGGCWERLIKIIELSSEEYVLQVDADTLVSDAIPEVVDCWRANRSFLLGTDVGQEVAPALAPAQAAQGWIETAKSNGGRITVCMLAEAALDSLPDAKKHRYVHASAGFAGFAQGAFRVRDLEIFSDLMRDRLGSRWDEWGTEQIGSNYILANAPGPVVLPFSRYACFEPHLPPGERPFLHFIGTYRFDKGLYRRQAQAFLKMYARESTASARDNAIVLRDESSSGISTG